MIETTTECVAGDYHHLYLQAALGAGAHLLGGGEGLFYPSLVSYGARTPESGG